MLPPTELEPEAELLPPTIPTGTPGVSATKLPSVRLPPRRGDQVTEAVQFSNEMRERPLALWIVLGALVVVALGVGIWLLVR